MTETPGWAPSRAESEMRVMPNETRIEAINPVIPVWNMDDALRFYEDL